VELVNFDRSIWLDHSGPRSLVAVSMRATPAPKCSLRIIGMLWTGRSCRRRQCWIRRKRKRATGPVSAPKLRQNRFKYNSVHDLSAVNDCILRFKYSSTAGLACTFTPTSRMPYRGSGFSWRITWWRLSTSPAQEPVKNHKGGELQSAPAGFVPVVARHLRMLPSKR
jgi:hypothetical protein